MTKSRSKNASGEHALATRRPARTGRAWSELVGVAVGSVQWEAARLPVLPWRELGIERREIATLLNIQKWFDLLPRIGAEPVAIPKIERDSAVPSAWHFKRREQAEFVDAALRCRKAATAAFVAFDAPAICRQAAGGDCGLWQLAIRPATRSETAPTGLSRSAWPGREPRHGCMRPPQWASHLSAEHFDVDILGRPSFSQICAS